MEEHGQNVHENNSGSEDSPIAKQVKVVLSPKRKGLIEEHRNFGGGVIGTEEWVGQLIQHFQQRDPAVLEQHVRYWLKKHKWITMPFGQPGYQWMQNLAHLVTVPRIENIYSPAGTSAGSSQSRTVIVKTEGDTKPNVNQRKRQRFPSPLEVAQQQKDAVLKYVQDCQNRCNSMNSMLGNMAVMLQRSPTPSFIVDITEDDE